jgi:hypothetical protein
VLHIYLKTTEMKKMIVGLMAAVMMLAFVPAHVQAVTEKGKTTAVAAKTVESPEATILVTRLNVIKAIDMSELSSVEKRALRSEVRSIKATLNQMEGGVIYISAGGLLLVIILLIILL